MKAELLPVNGDPPIRLGRDITLVGRRDDCDLRIDRPGLSKHHCALVKTDGLLVVRDLASTNGTKVNGLRVRWAALLPNDKVAFGGYKMRVYLGPDDVPSPSERRVASRTPPRQAPPPMPIDFPPPSTPYVPVPVGTGVAPEAIIDDDDDDEIVRPSAAGYPAEESDFDMPILLD